MAVSVDSFDSGSSLLWEAADQFAAFAAAVFQFRAGIAIAKHSMRARNRFSDAPQRRHVSHGISLE
jgi:hypothetical protein